MKQSIIFISFFLMILFVGLFSVNSAQAAMAVLSGKVADTAGNPVVKATIKFIDPTTHKTIQTVTTGNNGEYILQVPQGTYTVTISPQTASRLQTTTTNQIVSSNSTQNFTVVSILSPTPFVTAGTQAKNQTSNGGILSLLVLGGIVLVLGTALVYAFWKYKMPTV
jgi:hypothetical protein